MEEQKKDENLPVVIKERSLSNFVQIAKNKLYDAGRRGLKITGATTLAVTGLGVSALSSGAIALAGGAVAIYSGVRALQNVVYKTEPSLMFISRRGANGERAIFQDTRADLAAHMIGYKAAEKAGMMGLQTFVGFSRYKESLKGTPYMQREDGSKVYTQKYSTVTHTVNLKNFEYLEKLGLIEIESREENFKNTGAISKALGIEPKGKKSLLIAEKIGFNNYKSLKEIAQAAISRDEEALNSNKVTLEKVTFRLTDKPIDFEDMFLKVNGARPYESPEERVALGRFLGLFNEKRGILGKRGIDIGKDRLGRDIILYNKKENFADRMQEQLVAGKNRMKADKEDRGTEQKTKAEIQNDLFLEATNSKVDRQAVNEQIQRVTQEFTQRQNNNTQEDRIQNNEDQVK